MSSTARAPIGRNDPCPCGSGKKYKRCCLQQQAAAYELWARHRDASDHLAEKMLKFAEQKFKEDMDLAWQDFNMTAFPELLEMDSPENQIFFPYFIFQWNFNRRRSRKGGPRKVGVIARWFTMEKAASLSEMERLYLEQAAVQPVSFFEVLRSVPGERVEVRDILIGGEAEVLERSASRSLRQGDMVYAQVWTLPGLSIFGCCAPLAIPPRWKSVVIELRKKLQRRVAKQNRTLSAEDLVRYGDDIREVYLDIRDTLNAPPLLANTDGEPLVFHTVTFRIESAEAAFEALAPMAWGLPREDLLEGAEFDRAGKLRAVTFDWLKKGNAKMPTWDNTILGHLKISGHCLVAEVNSEKRAMRFRAEIEKRLGACATHQITTAQTLAEMLAKSPKRKSAQAKLDDQAFEEMLLDPQAKKSLQDHMQKQVEAWVYQKIPALGGRTPIEAVQDPDGREMVESLLVQWERADSEGVYNQGIRPDIGALRRILNLPSVVS